MISTTYADLRAGFVAARTAESAFLRLDRAGGQHSLGTPIGHLFRLVLLGDRTWNGRIGFRLLLFGLSQFPFGSLDFSFGGLDP